MNTFDIKTVADAAAELTRKTTQTMTEASTKAWKDFYAFGDTIAKAQADAVKGFTLGNSYADIYEAMNKFQADAVKNINGLFNVPNNTK